MSLQGVLAWNVLSQLISFFVSLCLLVFFTGRIRNFRRMVPAGVIYIVVTALIGAYCFKEGLFASEFPVFQTLFLYFDAFLLSCAVWFLQEERWSFSFYYGFLISFLGIAIPGMMVPILLRNYDLSVPLDFIVYTVENYVFAPIWTILVGYLFKSLGFSHSLNYLIREKGVNRFWRIFLFVLPCLNQLALYLANKLSMFHNSNPVVELAMLLLTYGMFSYVLRSEILEKQIQEQKASLYQQRLYVQNLEKVQAEMRIFRHDYKNMMAGMYLQAKEGDLQAVTDFISRMTADFDAQVGEQIRQTSSLAAIELPELKSVLLMKIMEAQKRGISCRLEVSGQVGANVIGMNQSDLCRALGILFDNAMEELQDLLKSKEDNKASDLKFDILIVSQKTMLSFVVKNSCRQTVDTARMWQEGYSTKGADRGLGLVSYRRIIEQYENVAAITAVKDGEFVQELRIAPTRKDRHGRKH